MSRVLPASRRFPAAAYQFIGESLADATEAAFRHAQNNLHDDARWIAYDDVATMRDAYLSRAEWADDAQTYTGTAWAAHRAIDAAGRRAAYRIYRRAWMAARKAGDAATRAWADACAAWSVPAPTEDARQWAISAAAGYRAWAIPDDSPMDDDARAWVAAIADACAARDDAIAVAGIAHQCTARARAYWAAMYADDAMAAACIPVRHAGRYIRPINPIIRHDAWAYQGATILPAKIARDIGLTPNVPVS